MPSYTAMSAESSIRYDLVGKIVAETELTRKAAAAILKGIGKSVLEEHSREVEVCVKLPRSFYVNIPVGNYSPDWAIALPVNIL